LIENSAQKNLIVAYEAIDFHYSALKNLSLETSEIKAREPGRRSSFLSRTLLRRNV
jgi:hypothetical protein